MSQRSLSIKDYFRGVKDPRVNRRKRHLLIDIIVIAVCGVICGADDWQAIETFAKLRHDWLKKFLRLPNGIPSHDILERVFNRINPQAFQAGFRDWMLALHEMVGLKQIAAKIIEQGGDYVLTVKDNQPSLLTDVQQCLQRALDKDLTEMDCDEYETHEKGHGREEKRHYIVVRQPEGLREQTAWSGLQVVGMCRSERTVAAETSEEVRYFIGSKRASAKIYGQALRHHWGIENNLHWQLDVSFGEDSSRINNRNAAENFALLRKLALVLLKRHPAKLSIARKRLSAALNPTFLEETLSQSGDSGKI